MALDRVLPLLLCHRVRVVLENRPMRYMFGALNYGEVPGCRNAADGDCWDIFAPGYARRLPFTTYRVSDVLGVLWLENGNHKIAVAIDAPGFNATRAAREIGRYAQTYCAKMRLKGEWRPLGPAARRPSMTTRALRNSTGRLRERRLREI